MRTYSEASIVRSTTKNNLACSKKTSEIFGANNFLKKLVSFSLRRNQLFIKISRLVTCINHEKEKGTTSYNQVFISTMKFIKYVKKKNWVNNCFFILQYAHLFS